jgi:hypothetical protein
MFVYELKVKTININAFDPTVFEEETEDGGLYTSLKKAKNTFINMVDDECFWLIKTNQPFTIRVQNEYLSVRIEKKGEIVWFEGYVIKRQVL